MDILLVKCLQWCNQMEQKLQSNHIHPLVLETHLPSNLKILRVVCIDLIVVGDVPGQDSCKNLALFP